MVCHDINVGFEREAIWDFHKRNRTYAVSLIASVASRECVSRLMPRSTGAATVERIRIPKTVQIPGSFVPHPCSNSPNSHLSKTAPAHTSVWHFKLALYCGVHAHDAPLWTGRGQGLPPPSVYRPCSFLTRPDRRQDYLTINCREAIEILRQRAGLHRKLLVTGMRVKPGAEVDVVIRGLRRWQKQNLIVLSVAVPQSSRSSASCGWSNEKLGSSTFPNTLLQFSLCLRLARRVKR